MARGAAQQEKLLNTQAGTSFGNAQALYQNANSGFSQLAQNGGYTPTQQSAITAGSLSPIAAQTSAAKSNLYNMSARTRNDAGIISGADALTRQGAQAMGTAGNQVQTQIAQNQQQQRLAGLQGEASLYGPSLSSAGTLYGQAERAMEARPSVMQTLTGWKNLLTPPGAGGGVNG